MNLNKSNVILVTGETDDHKLASVRQLASKPSKGKFRRHVCLQVSSQQLLRQLQTQDLGDGIAEKLELHPYSFEELWAQKLFVSLPKRRVVSSPLDWKPICYDSDYRVHLIVFGMNSMTEALVRQACLVCHYPNYLRDSNLKTRITIIDSSIKEEDNLILRRYRTLMDNCRWSFVDKYGCETMHKPECGYLGGEFTDIEFQFIAAESSTTIVRVMMTELARNANELLTVVFDGDNGEDNWDLATGLPAEYYMEGCDIPIYVRMKSTMMLGSPTLMPQYRNIRPFGMDDCEFDLSLPLTQIAIGVSYIYNHCFTTNDANCDKVDRRRALELWNQEKAVNRFSSEALAMTIVTKLRSRGKADDEPLSVEDIAIMAEVEHNRWSVERLMSGVRPVTPDEQKLIDEDRSLKKKMRDRGAHYDLRPFSALREDSAGNNVQLYDEALIRGLQPIVDAFEKHDTGEKMIVVKREVENPSGKWKKKAKRGAIAVAIIIIGLFVNSFLNDYNAESRTKKIIGQYVYQLSVDSIEVWNGSNGVEAVLTRNSTNNVLGTAFALDGVGIVTARHCIEYWLYDSIQNVNDPSKWTDEMALAIEVETYNDTTKGEHKRMVAVCSLLDDKGKVFMDRVVFEVDNSHDKVCRVGKSNAKWRYVIPLFDGDREMLQSDIAVFRRKSVKGIKLSEGLSDVDFNACYLGYPQDNDIARGLSSYKAGVSKSSYPFIKLGCHASKGFSGGPVVTWDFLGHYSVVGVTSHNDPYDENGFWAITINFNE